MIRRAQSEAGPRQIALDLGHRAARSADDLVVSAANREAVGLVRRWPDWPSSVVVLAGPPGSGKSHLADVWSGLAGAAKIDQADPRAGVGPASEGVPVLIDGIARGSFDEGGLFHLINAVNESRTHLLIATRSFPSSWNVALPDLASRLKAAATVEILEPDDALLAGVMTKLFADRQVEVDPSVVDYLVRRIERSLATAIDVVERLDRTALERGSGITRSLAAELVGAMDEGQSSLDL